MYRRIIVGVLVAVLIIYTGYQTKSESNPTIESTPETIKNDNFNEIIKAINPA